MPLSTKDSMRSFKYMLRSYKLIINIFKYCAAMCFVYINTSLCTLYCFCVQALHSGAMKSIADTSSAKNKRYNRFKNICPCMC